MKNVMREVFAMTGKKWFMILSVLMLLAVSAVSPARADSDTWYVYTANGKTLNVRSAPFVSDGTLVGHLAYGSKVQVLYFEGNWACIYYHWNDGVLQGDECWVQKRFLVRNRPESRTSGNTSKEATTSGQLGVLNREFKTLQQVNPFTVISKPIRSSGFVNLRWAPHDEAEIAGIAYYGHSLTVLASTTNWYQVEDPDTGKICFIMKKFTMAQ